MSPMDGHPEPPSTAVYIPQSPERLILEKFNVTEARLGFDANPFGTGWMNESLVETARFGLQGRFLDELRQRFM
jgi:hypothetical protein